VTAPLEGALATPRILQPVETPAGETLPIIDAVLQIVRAGGTREAAATWAKVHPATLSRWVSKGLEIWEQLDGNPDNQEKQAGAIENPEDPLANATPTQRPYLDLAIMVAQAETATEMRLVTSLHEAAKVDWRAALAALQARERGTWNPTPRLVVTGPGGGPVTHGVTVLSDVAFAQKVAELERRRAVAIDVAEAAHA
jgi:hypothetical protein